MCCALHFIIIIIVLLIFLNQRIDYLFFKLLIYVQIFMCCALHISIVLCYFYFLTNIYYHAMLFFDHSTLFYVFPNTKKKINTFNMIHFFFQIFFIITLVYFIFYL